MKVLDPGHSYLLNSYDSALKGETIFTSEFLSPQIIKFVKRMGAKYPGNTTTHSGTIMQELLRVLIHRAKHLERQEHWFGNQDLIDSSRLHLYQLEVRAADRHGRTLKRRHLDRDNDGNPVGIEDEPTCYLCGHIECGGSCRAD